MLRFVGFGICTLVVLLRFALVLGLLGFVLFGFGCLGRCFDGGLLLFMVVCYATPVCVADCLHLLFSCCGLFAWCV